MNLASTAPIVMKVVFGWMTLLVACSLCSQPQPPAFEVATVKQSPPPPGESININLGTVRNGTLTMTNASLNDCLRFAYGLVSDAQISGPDWITSKATRFDIVAKAKGDTPRDQFPVMLRALLADRLKLVFHYESRALPFLALVVEKNLPLLGLAKSDAAPAAGPPAVPVTSPAIRCRC